MANKEHVIGIFLDLSKAFDTLNHAILIRKLQSYGIRGQALSWFKDYLSNRKQYVTFNGTDSCLLAISCGVPQGSSLGPLLFLLYVNDICNASPLLSFILFADDTNIFCSHSNLQTLINTLNSELPKVSQWLKCNKLSLNINKTHFIHFKHHNVHLAATPLNIKIDDSLLEQKQNSKFLGVIIDENLTWNPHIRNITSHISKGVGIISRLKFTLPLNTLFCYITPWYYHIYHIAILFGLIAESQKSIPFYYYKKEQFEFVQDPLIFPIQIHYSTNWKPSRYPI